MLLQVAVIYLFPLIYNISQCEWTTVYFFHCLVDGHEVCQTLKKITYLSLLKTFKKLIQLF